MNYPMRQLEAAEFPPLLREIPQPPKQLYLRGALPDPSLPLLTVVGSRRYTTYGAQALDHLIGGLRHYRVGIVSGLAIGVDGLAHEAALTYGLYTLAIPGSGLSDSVLYPRRHQRLARRILEAGGGLMSEYDETTTAQTWTFPERNRLVAGVARGTLLIEAAEQSGTLITARLTTDYNRELFVVPGNIFSENSRGVHQFLKLGATPVTVADDIAAALHLQPVATEAPKVKADPATAGLLTFLTEPRDLDAIVRHLKTDTGSALSVLMKLQLLGSVIEREGLYRAR